MNALTDIGNDFKQMWTRAKDIKSYATFKGVSKDFFDECGVRIKSIYEKAVGALKAAFKYIKGIWDNKIAPEYRHFKLWHLGLLATALIPAIAIPCILGP